MILGKMKARQGAWARLSWWPAVLLLQSRWKQRGDPLAPHHDLPALLFSLSPTPIYLSAPSSSITSSVTSSWGPRATI